MLATGGKRSPIAKTALVLTAVVCMFTAENIWIDPWLAKKSHHKLPSLVPEALSGMWFLVLMALGIAIILAVLCQVLLMKTAGFPGWKKAMTGVAVLAAVSLTFEWFLTTGATRIAGQVGSPQKHAVVLHWRASSSKNVRYNIYRGSAPGIHPDKLNVAPVDGLTFADTNIQSGRSYYYVARAVDATGRESTDSNETLARIP